MCRTYGGTGLGLTISKSYIELMKGKIWLESKENEGTTVYFSIPFILASSTTDATIQESGVILELQNRKILVVDDELQNFELILDYLKDLNCDILYASNGAEALNILQSDNTVNLILMDLKMPIMNGFEATQKIKKINPGMPIVAITAYIEHIIDLPTIGFNDHISKPINKDELFQIIARNLKD